jgi:SAM-dependent methyltransferase
VSEAIIQRAAIGPGQRVLDLACGTGELALTIATRVQPGGSVLATDLSPAMVEATRRRAVARGVSVDATGDSAPRPTGRAGVAPTPHRLAPLVDARVMDIEALELSDASFDAVTCRFGLMFCPDLERAARELGRVLRPGGRFAVAVWAPAEHNPFFTAIGAVVRRFELAPPPDPSAPGVFRLGAPGALEAMLGAGGVTSVTVEPMELVFTYASPEEYWAIQREIVGPLRTSLTTMSAAEVARVREAVLEVALVHQVGGEVRLAGQALICYGTR